MQSNAFYGHVERQGIVVGLSVLKYILAILVGILGFAVVIKNFSRACAQKKNLGM